MEVEELRSSLFDLIFKNENLKYENKMIWWMLSYLRRIGGSFACKLYGASLSEDYEFQNLDLYSRKTF